MVRDPIEQARIDFVARGSGDWPPEACVEKFEEWGSEGMRLYTREMRSLQPAEAPLPWAWVAAFMVFDGVMAESLEIVERRWREDPTLLLVVPAVLGIAGRCGKARGGCGARRHAAAG